VIPEQDGASSEIRSNLTQISFASRPEEAFDARPGSPKRTAVMAMTWKSQLQALAESTVFLSGSMSGLGGTWLKPARRGG
jgi:hypothetical protein